jgi:hypothetical protein
MDNLPKWKKQGRIFTREDGYFFKSHAMRVVPYLRKEGVLRLFITSRCSEDIMHPTYIDVDPDNPMKVIRTCEKPILKLGSPGLFDDSSIILGSIARIKFDDYIYYTGWKRRRYGVYFESSIGVARILDDGNSLEKISMGPIIAQDRYHPFLVAAPYVTRSENTGYNMWYCSGTDWKQRDFGPEPIYTVFHGVSKDGISWRPQPHNSIIPYSFDGEVISAPWVVRLKNYLLMYYSYRGSSTRLEKNYSMGVAVSSDGEKWERKDAEVGINKSESGWDSEMICYPAIFNGAKSTYMFYSGNGVGRGGVGYAVAEDKLDILE